jgi:quercetin dioxygenase-like cupin family protein
MDPVPGRELRNPFSGQTTRLVSLEPDLLVLESSYAAGGAPAPEHLHPAQDEHFTVLSGTVLAGVDGERRILREGDELEVPAGTPHEFGGAPEQAGTVRWEVRPALRTWEFLELVHENLEAAAEEREPARPLDPAEWDDVFRLA